MSEFLTTPSYETAGEVERPGLAQHRPWVTFGVLAVLFIMFGVEQWLDGDARGSRHGFSVMTLTILGGLERGLVVQQGQWYRLMMAPLLHADFLHILLNGAALLLAGYLVERLVGHAWMLALFFIGALSGSLLSLATASDHVVSVGASGAIMALFAAAFVAAWHLRDGTPVRSRLQAQSARILIPSLMPLADSGSAMRIDYGAHFGGAIAGGIVGFLLLTIWPVQDRLPRWRGAAWAIIAIGSVLLAASLFPVVRQVVEVRG